ncbi:reticulon-like protein B17 isoform X1 [Diospyros lotus]|uniref:reticulon-like protein B17 isoform X1 n=1 Tax=Diospyros lotus TaxID=55363 RepID=UPI002258F3F6|nr:reticulon-like protein B17 isoform X1 [Diospyros lotus]
MDSTPPSHRSEPRSRLKSASRLARLAHFDRESEDSIRLSIDLVSSPKITNQSPSPRPQTSLPLHELLLLSPSHLRRSKTRVTEAGEEAVEPAGSRRRCKNRNGSICASPRNVRRSRRRLETEAREERDLGMVEEMGKVRKRRHSGRSKKERLSLVPSVAPPKTSDGDQCNLDKIRQLTSDLIMWNDVAKSSLWFGFGSLCFLSSCFAREINFSIFSCMSQLGLLLLGLSFFSNSICQRGNVEQKREFKLKEDDILRAATVILPTLNLAISKTRQLFSGEPSMTLKVQPKNPFASSSNLVLQIARTIAQILTSSGFQVTPFLLLGAEYGHLLTLKRLCALGFFVSFTGPKLYSCYCVQINSRVEGLIRRLLEAWRACSHKKIVAASAVTAFWNLSCIRTRIFAAFIFLVVLRCFRQHSEAKVEEVMEEQEVQQKALVVV